MFVLQRGVYLPDLARLPRLASTVVTRKMALVPQIRPTRHRCKGSGPAKVQEEFCPDVGHKPYKGKHFPDSNPDEVPQGN